MPFKKSKIKSPTQKSLKVYAVKSSAIFFFEGGSKRDMVAIIKNCYSTILYIGCIDSADEMSVYDLK